MKQKFKKGDKVRCIIGLSEAGTVKDKIYTISRINEDSEHMNGWLVLKKTRPWSHNPERFELACKFKVGDKVKCIDEDGYSLIKKGQIYTVKEIICSGFIKVISGSTDLYYKSKLFELVEKVEVEKEEVKSKYKVGDKVLVHWPESTRYNGKVLTIKRIEDDKYCYFEEAVLDIHCFNINKIVKIIKPEETQHGYEVGDKVIVKGYSQRWDGKILTISNIYESGGEELCNFKESDRPDLNFHIGNIVRKVKPEEMKHKYKVGDKVRFKTEDEFLKEFGPDWRRNVKYSWNSDGEMDYLFGKHFIIESIDDKYVEGHREGWNVSTDMITPDISIPSSSSYHYYKVGDKITLMGIEYTLYGEEGYYYWDSNGLGSGKIFDVLDLNKESFTKSIVGYYGEGAFPPMKTLEDIEKITNALITKCSEHYSSQPDLKLGDKVVFRVDEEEYRYKVNKDSVGYYCSNYNNYNEEIFNVLGITKKEASSKALGYYEGGWFPYTYTLEDLTILVNYIREKCIEHNRRIRNITLRKPAWKTTDFKVGDTFEFEGVDGKWEILHRDDVYYCRHERYVNSLVFDYLELDSEEKAYKIYGYYLGGLFPNSKTIEDLNNMIRYLQERCIYKSRKGYSEPFPSVYQDTADKVNIFKLETNEDSIEKPEVKHIINIFDYEV